VTIQKGAEAASFMPESAARIEPAPAFAAGGARGVMTMIIDYHALAKAPMPAAMSMPMAKTTPITPLTPPAVPVMAAAQVKTQAVSSSPGEDELLAQKLDDVRVAKEALVKKDSEIKMLRKESEWMKRELRNRDEEIKALRLTKVSSKPAPKKKPAHATRTR
jgi:hypothetical protein